MSIIDFDSRSGQPRKKKLGLALIASACIAGVISIGSVVAGGISLNGGGGRAEFGQGYVTTTTCDPNGIEVTPDYSYVNRAGQGSFTFLNIRIEGVSANCAGKDLIVKVYNSNGEAIVITRDATTTYREIRVHFRPFSNATSIVDDNPPNPADTVLTNGSWADQFKLVGSPPIVILTLSNLASISGDDEIPDPVPTNPAPSAASYFVLDQNENAFLIVFDPAGANATGFADARDVYNISIQSVDHQS
jgi:hypothetical protein